MAKKEQDTETHWGYGNLANDPMPELGGDSSSGGSGRMKFLYIAVLGLVLLLFAAGAGAYVLDESKKDQIADGVTIGGIDVGGLNRDEAVALVRHDLLSPLKQSVIVKYDGKSWKLPASKLNVRADVDGMVDRALAASQEGGLPNRVARYVTGGKVDETISPKVAYSDSAINKFVKRVAGALNEDPVDASVSPTASSLNLVKGKLGQKLRDIELEKAIRRSISLPGPSAPILAKVHTTDPEVTKADLASKYPTYLTVDKSDYTVRLWKNLKLVESYTVAYGQPAYPTPDGLFDIQSKQVDPVWSVPNSDWAGSLAGTTVPGGSPDNPLVARWMGIIDGVGFHGTNDTYSLGSAASHGCIRMDPNDAIDLYDRIEVGTPVYIGYE